MEQPIVARVRQQIDRVFVRVRTALDLPSRAELVDLTRRLEDLDRRIAELAADRVAAMSAPLAALPESSGPIVVVTTPEAAAEELAAEATASATAAAVASDQAVVEAATEGEPVAAAAEAPKPPQPQHSKKNGKNRRR